MIPIMSYIHQYYKRSYRYVAPLISYLSFILFLYSIVPNPVMESYALSSALMFVIAAWMCYGFIDMEDETQQMITSLHASGLSRVITTKLVYISIFQVPLSMFAVLYPALMNKFDRVPFIYELLMSFAAHQIGAMLGIAIAAWFTSRLIASRMLSFLGLVAALVLSIAGEGITNQLPEALRFLSLLVPPYRLLMNMLTNYEETAIVVQIMAIVVPLSYTLLLMGIYVWMMNRRRFDYARGDD